MTNEQHIENLKKLKSFHNGSYDASVNAAINALEHEQALKEAFNIAVLYGKEKGMEAIDKALYQIGKDGIKEQEIKALEQQPCEDAISRQAVLEAIDAKAWEFCDYLISKNRNDEQKPVSHFADNLRECVSEDLPPVNAQPKTGHWIVDGSVDCYLDKVRCHCSECGKKKEFPADYDHIKHKLSISYQYPEFIDNYCPNCGAKMVDPQESGDKE